MTIRDRGAVISPRVAGIRSGLLDLTSYVVVTYCTPHLFATHTLFDSRVLHCNLIRVSWQSVAHTRNGIGRRHDNNGEREDPVVAVI